MDEARDNIVVGACGSPGVVGPPNFATPAASWAGLGSSPGIAIGLRHWLAVSLAVSLLSACATDHSFSVSLIEPSEGAVLSGPFKVKLAARGVNVEPAGEVKPGSGHHHLLVDMDAIPAGSPVPGSEHCLHLDHGESEAELTLPPGPHKLTAQFANGAQLSFGLPMSQTITVTVK